MKKTLRTILLGCLCITMLSGCTPKITNHITLESSDANMSEYKWIGDTIGDFRKITIPEAHRFFTEKGSGILYMGKPNCPWCERAVPVLNEVALENKLTIWYINAADPEETSDIATLKQDLHDALPVDSSGARGLYLPIVVGIKNGVITGHHTSLVDGFTIKEDDDQMNDDQKTELKNLYLDILKRTAD